MANIGMRTFCGGCFFDLAYPGLITIGNDCILSFSTFLAHDSLGVNQDGFCKVGKVTIGNRVSVGYGSIIHPGVVIEDGAIVAAGSCVVSGTVIKSGEVFGGSPATKIGTVEAYMEKRRFRYRGRDIEVAASRGIRILKGDTANRADLAEKLHPGETLLIPHTGRYSINAEGEENG